MVADGANPGGNLICTSCNFLGRSNGALEDAALKYNLTPSKYIK